LDIKLKSKNKGGFGRDLSRAIFLRFFVTLVIYVVAIVFILTAAQVFLRLFVWQHENFFYRLFKLIDSNAFAFIVVCGLIGFIFIFIFYWKKTLGYIDTIVEASGVLVEQGDDIIQLPAELKEVEIRMNQAKQDVVRNSKLAKEAEQRKNDLVMYLAHDIKTPLTSVIGYLSLLDEAPDMPTEQKAKYIHITLNKAYRLEQLIDEFFEITRYNLHTIMLSKKNIDLYYMLVQMADEFYPQLSANGKKVNIHASEDLTVYGDPDKLARVFNNVLKNAMAYSPDNSVIDIAAAILDNMVSIVFTNAGSIPKDKLTSIFDKFYRLDSARSSDTGGSGLGLAIAREIIAAHGGQIYAESDRGQTTFTVELPFMPEQS